MKTVSIHAEDTATGGVHAPEWLLVDASTQPLGRVATQVAHLLRGKHKPIFTPHVDTGDFVVIVNAAHIKLTGNKLKDKWYYHHTGFPGGLKAIWAERLLLQKPTELIRLAIKRMMPRNALNRKILHGKLKIYPGPEHPHQAQQPRPYTLPR
jgi:large subunit ribosomal protein L13